MLLNASARAGLVRAFGRLHVPSRSLSEAVKIRKPWEVILDAPPLPPSPPQTVVLREAALSRDGRRDRDGRDNNRDRRDGRDGRSDRDRNGQRRGQNQNSDPRAEMRTEKDDEQEASTSSRAIDEWKQRQADYARRKAKAARTNQRKEQPAKPVETRLVELTSKRKNVQELSALFGVSIKRLSQALEYLGYWNRSKSVREIGSVSLTLEQCELVAADLGIETVRKIEELDVKKKEKDESRANLPPRAPIVTVMGHVDHGKTSLLDALRKTSVAAGEAGGITQHLGAFEVAMPSGASITFLDTPGHAAFTSIRARGAQVTDVVVLVVAADDGVMPQTVEAIKHAQAAQVAIVVAINKCDVPDANPRKVREQLLSHNVVCEEFGGDALSVEISAKTGKNLDKLEEAILLQASMLDIRAENKGSAEATILETRMDKHYGVVASAVVREGRLEPGDYIVAGNQSGRVRLLLDHTGKQIQEALPSQPCMIIGLKGSPSAGDEVLVVDSEERAAQVCAYRTDLLKQRELENTKIMMEENEDDEDEFSGMKVSKKKARMLRNQSEMAKRAAERAQLASGEARAAEVSAEDAAPPKVAVLIKADVTGSLEAIQHMLSLWPTDEVEVVVVAGSLGDVTMSDLQQAAALNADIYAFNVSASPAVAEAARQMSLRCKEHNIIYRLLEEVRDNASELLPAQLEVVTLAKAEVLQIFKMKLGGGVTKVVAGTRVSEGTFARRRQVQVIRNGNVVYEGAVTTLKHFKDDVSEVKQGQECGIAMDGFDDVQQGDIIQSIEKRKVERKITVPL